MDHEEIEEMVAVLRNSRLAEMEVRQGERVLRLRRPPARRTPPAPARPVPPASQEPAVAVTLPPLPITTVTADLVGIYHTLPEPLREGDRVAERQILGQIESMRLMNDVVSPASGRILQVLVEDGQPVMYGQSLFEITEEDAA